MEHTFGRGRTLLIGTFPGAGYYLHHQPETKSVFAGFLESAGISQIARIDDTAVQARLQKGNGGTYLWVTNPTREDRTVRIQLSAEHGAFSRGEDIWGGQNVSISGQQIGVSVGGRNAVVIQLK